MQVQVNTDKNIEGDEALVQQAESTVEDALSRFGNRITRVEVHLSDENSHKGGSDDKKCMMEARPTGMQPLAVTHSAGTLDEAIDGAASKLKRLLSNSLGRLNDAKGRTSFSGDQDV